MKNVLQVVASFLRVFLPVKSLVLYVLVMACFLFRWDKVALVTALPFLFWALIGLGATALAAIFLRGRFAAYVSLLWLLTALVYSDECASLRHGKFHVPKAGKPKVFQQKKPLRLVTLNCKERNLNAVREVLTFKPDIIFLQESPGHSQIKPLLTDIYGKDGATSGNWACRILTRAKIVSFRAFPGSRSIFATLRFENGTVINVVNIHLSSAETRLDFWNRSAWRAHAINRKKRRAELEKIVAQFPAASQHPLLVAGDFNAPAGDAVFRLLRPRLRDAHRIAGKGWPNTMTSSFPIHRIDQVWIEKEIRPAGLAAHANKHSDHRMVVFDFLSP